MRTIALLGVMALISCSKADKTGHAGTGSGDPVDTGTDPKVPPPAPTEKQSAKGDCKLAYAPRPKRDPNPMCKVDGGTFTMTDPAAGTTKTVTLSPYYMDQFEVTVGQVVLFLNATGGGQCSDPYERDHACFRISDGSGDARAQIRKQPDGRFVAVAGAERRPYTGASRQGAGTYCTWVGKALPTEPQWEFAARHDPKSGKDFLYPWGEEFDGKRARCAHDQCPDGPDTYDPVDVGTYDGTNGHADGSSPWGLFDMAGNAAEHVADCGFAYEPCSGAVCKDPPPAPPRQGSCEVVSRGGGAVNGPRQLRTIDRAATAGGIRCARM